MANFDSIKTIGLLSNPKNETEINEIDKIVKHFQSLDKQTFPLIYFDKQIKNDIFSKNIDWNGLGKDKCNWIGKPKNDINLNRFLTKEFDVLIDFSFSPVFCLQYIFIRSKAQLKIMPTNDFSKKFADLMLQISDSSSKFDFAKELTRYLKIINKDQK